MKAGIGGFRRVKAGTRKINKRSDTLQLRNSLTIKAGKAGLT